MSRILIAPDSFKGSATSIELASTINLRARCGMQ